MPGDVVDRSSCNGDTMCPYSEHCRALLSRNGRAYTPIAPSTFHLYISWRSTCHPDVMHALEANLNPAVRSLRKLGTMFFCSERCSGLRAKCDRHCIAKPLLPSCPHKQSRGTGHLGKQHASANPSSFASYKFALCGSRQGTRFHCLELCPVWPPRCVPACTATGPFLWT